MKKQATTTVFQLCGNKTFKRFAEVDDYKEAMFFQKTTE